MVRLHADQLESRLKQQLDPVYLICGDEPLQLSEAADAVRLAATRENYSDKVTLDSQTGFRWDDLVAEADVMSLFADKRIIDLRLKSAAIGAEGSKALNAYCDSIPQDTLLLITAPKLDRKQLGNKWVKAIDKIGVILQVWPIEGRRLLPWLEQRMRKKGLTPEPGVVPMLAERVEGNLLAADQEIEKLLLMNGAGVVSTRSLGESVADSARFDVFALVDKALSGDAARCVRILEGLRAEGVAPPVVLWALAREVRGLASIGNEIARGASPSSAMSKAGVWEKRKPLVQTALRHLKVSRLGRLTRLCAEADSVIKGVSTGNPWHLFEEIALSLAGVEFVFGN